MKFLPVHNFDNYIDAHIFRMRLEEEGISCWLRDEYSVTIDPILTNAIGGIKLMVPEVQAERAIQLIDDINKSNRRSKCCPKCCSDNVELISSPRSINNWVSAIAGFLFGNYAIASKKVYRCFDCGEEFDYLYTSDKETEPS